MTKPLLVTPDSCHPQLACTERSRRDWGSIQQLCYHHDGFRVKHGMTKNGMTKNDTLQDSV